MKHRFKVALATSLILCVATSSKAEIGTLEEVIQAAKTEIEPSYIEPLMSDLGNRFSHHVNTRGIISSRDRCALMLAMLKIAGYQRATLEATVQVAHHEAEWNRPNTRNYDLYHKHALERAGATANKVSWGVAQQLLFKVTSNVAGAETAQKILLEYLGRPSFIREAAQNAIDGLKAYALRGTTPLIAYRMVEWQVLNFMHQNAERIFDAAFREALEILPAGTEYPQLLNDDAWDTFIFHQINPRTESGDLFLRHFLRPLQTSMYGGPQIYQFQLGRLDIASPVHLLPRDLVRLISIWTQPHFYRSGQWSQ